MAPYKPFQEFSPQDLIQEATSTDFTSGTANAQLPDHLNNTHFSQPSWLGLAEWTPITSNGVSNYPVGLHGDLDSQTYTGSLSPTAHTMASFQSSPRWCATDNYGSPNPLVPKQFLLYTRPRPPPVPLPPASKMRSTGNQGDPLPESDESYTALLSTLPPSTLSITKKLLGLLIFLNTRSVNVLVCNFRLMCKIIDIPEDIAVGALRLLDSVLYFPKAKDISQTRPRFFHVSFRDFLQDESRSHEYFIDKEIITIGSIQSIACLAQAQFSSDPAIPLLPLLIRQQKPERLASYLLECVFHGDFSPNGVVLKSHGNDCVVGSLLDGELQPLLESLSAIKVMKYAPMALRSWCWYNREGSEYELTQRGFLSWTTVGSLNINWDTVSMTTSRLGGCWHVHVGLPTGIQSEFRVDHVEVQEIRHRFKAAAPDTKARIWGHTRSNCHVVAVELEEHRMHVITGVSLLTNAHCSTI